MTSKLPNRHGRTRCAAPSCDNYSGIGKSFFRFPKDEARCRKWIVNSGATHLDKKPTNTLYKNERLCSDHFELSQFQSDDRNRLFGDAIPTLFQPLKQPQEAETTSKRKAPRQRRKDQQKSQGDILALGQDKTELMEESSVQQRRILLACTGSVASIKMTKLLDQLLALDNGNVILKVVLTEKAKHFIDMPAENERVQFYSDDDEWKAWSKIGDDVLHIELGKWADMMVIAPLSANSMAKIATGICDNLLTCTVRAWDTVKPLLFAPAMNTRMWNHPITVNQIQILNSWGYSVIPPIEKKLACGDTGVGAMAEVETIVHQCSQLMQNDSS